MKGTRHSEEQIYANFSGESGGFHRPKSYALIRATAIRFELRFVKGHEGCKNSRSLLRILAQQRHGIGLAHVHRFSFGSTFEKGAAGSWKRIRGLRLDNLFDSAEHP
jgi:hypothetical protein